MSLVCALRFDALRSSFYDPVPVVLSEAKDTRKADVLHVRDASQDLEGPLD